MPQGGGEVSAPPLACVQYLADESLGTLSRLERRRWKRSACHRAAQERSGSRARQSFCHVTRELPAAPYSAEACPVRVSCRSTAEGRSSKALLSMGVGRVSAARLAACLPGRLVILGCEALEDRRRFACRDSRVFSPVRPPVFEIILWYSLLT